jgi:hypothetical protein
MTPESILEETLRDFIFSLRWKGLQKNIKYIYQNASENVRNRQIKQKYATSFTPLFPAEINQSAIVMLKITDGLHGDLIFTTASDEKMVSISQSNYFHTAAIWP